MNKVLINISDKQAALIYRNLGIRGDIFSSTHFRGKRLWSFSHADAEQVRNIINKRY